MYELSGLFIYKVVFMVELLLSELLFLWHLPKRPRFALRLIGCIFVCVLFSIVIPILVDDYNAVYISAMFLLMFFFSVIAMRFCFDNNFFSLLFCCIAGYSVQHISYEFFNLMLVAMNLEGGALGIYGEVTVSLSTFISSFFSNPLVLVLYLGIYAAIYTAGFFLFALKIRGEKEIKLKNSSLFILVVLIVVVDVVMNAGVLQFVSNMISIIDQKVLSVFSALYNIFCCALAIYIQFELVARKNLEEELNLIKYLRYTERVQYENSKANIELINLKCHDMKHQIATIGREQQMPLEYIDEIKEVISIYDSVVETGNKTLDIILTEKSLQCNEKKIKFICIVDGQKLSFMKESDVYSLFGNIIENAIEAVSDLDEEKRIISIKVNETDGMLIIDESNYYENPLIFIDGSLQTLKKDEKYHGFGLKSIKYIAEKYGGEIHIAPHDKIFNIVIQIPLK